MTIVYVQFRVGTLPVKTIDVRGKFGAPQSAGSCPDLDFGFYKLHHLVYDWMELACEE
jgi:hypothetical protein